MAASDESATGVDPAEVVALLTRPPEDFVPARTARAKELRAEGRRDEAAALAKIRKPVRLVWVVGELARRNPDVATAAAAVAEEVEEAMAGGGGVRPLLARFREVVGDVAGLADALDGTVDRLQVGLALREVLADPEAREEWVQGRLLALPGDDPVAPPVDELAPRRAARQKGGSTKGTRGRHPSGTDADAAARDAAEREAAEAAAREEAQHLADEAVDRAVAEVQDARDVHDGASSALADMEVRLAALEAEVADARATAGAAGDALEDAEARLVAAERDRSALDDGGGGSPRRGRRRR